MLCAHTVRRLKPGSFHAFTEAFPDDPPAGWVRFHALRGIADPDEVVTFGFFDGTLAELERSQEASGYRELRDRIDPLVEAVVANGIYEIAISREARPALAG